MINQYDMESVWIEHEDGQEMIIPKLPAIRKTEQLSLSEQMDILAEQVRDALSEGGSRRRHDASKSRKCFV